MLGGQVSGSGLYCCAVFYSSASARPLVGCHHSTYCSALSSGSGLHRCFSWGVFEGRARGGVLQYPALSVIVAGHA